MTPARRRLFGPLGPLLLLICLLFGDRPVVAAEPFPGITDFQLDTFAANIMNALEQGRLDIVVRSFHLDPQMDPEQKEYERDDLAELLGGIVSQFGLPGQSDRLQESRDAYQFVLQSLTSDYWDQYSRFLPVSYRVRYPIAGEGYLTLAIVVYDRRLQLRSLSFGLPVAVEGNRQRMQQLTHALKGEPNEHLPGKEQ